ISGKTWPPSRSKLRSGRATEVGTDTDCNEMFGLAGAPLVLRVRWCEPRPGRVRIGHFTIRCFEGGQHFWGAMQHPNRFPTPLDGNELARRNGTDIDLYRSTGCARTRRMRKRTYQRYGG